VPEGVAWARYPDGYDVWLGDGSTKQVRSRAISPPPSLPTVISHRLPLHRLSLAACLSFRSPPPLTASHLWQVGEDELILGKTWKLNAERNNGRAAMMGVTGCLIHEALTGNPVFPIGETL
jgi:hypothetical protein